MKRDNEIYLKLFWGRSSSSNPRQRLRWLYQWWPMKTPASAAATTIVVVVFCFVATLLSSFAGRFDVSIFAGVSRSEEKILPPPIRQEFPLKCAKQNETQTCSRDYPARHNPSRPWNRTCPAHFRFIHEDLRPWRETGITRDMVEGARRTAHFRVVILDGRVYVDKYRKSIQTRDLFTLWGILQLTRWYPSKLPDLEMMFDCDDRPVVASRHHRGPQASPPPLFRYCSDDRSLDIVFPDWSFWGWAEINLKPWKDTLEDIKEGNKKIKWEDRVPYAYWKGNPHVAPTRRDLMKCNVSNEHDWNTRIYVQDWVQESKQGYKASKLEDQCTHRYKIYIEGWAWSVSEKYILACDAMTLYVRPKYYDFFIRGMMPLQHYWPVSDSSKCTSLKFAVEWGNNHTHQAQAIGEAASRFMQEDLKIDYVYDYMFHLLNEYAKLLKFKPTVPPTATELCPETMACGAQGNWRKFMEESLVKFPSDSLPCSIPPDDVSFLKDFRDRKANATRQAQLWEKEYWQSQIKAE
ncbi:O-glucosyltransferase rumi homolog [Neltuma alba]|uniref:O-glucosyltransferase rumi homolog n=1 Tax=Neltuma alba TaxID=207710 RepID=UPI0010A3F5F6|nr:O-glucosyltransferase rumi homolog [Prosopis alba]